MSEPAKRGSNGGNARAAKLTKEQRSDIAKKAAQKRWGKLKEESEPQTPRPSIINETPLYPVPNALIYAGEIKPTPEPIPATPERSIPTRMPSTPTPAERGRRRASKDKPVSKVYRQALSTAEKEYAETVEELSYHDEMAARLKSKLPRLIQTIRALGGTIDPQAELLQSRQMQPSNYGAPAQNYPIDPSQNLPNPIDPALYATNNTPLPGITSPIAQVPPPPNTSAGGAIDLDFKPQEDEGPPLPRMGGGWV
jgi:hypothetical protein